MRQGWQSKKLGEVAQFINGRAYKKNELLDGGPYPVLRVGNFFTNRNWYYSNLELEPDKYCDDGDLLYAWSASFGPRIWDGGKAIYHYHIWKIEPNQALIDKRFLFHFLEWDKEKIQLQHGAGTTMVHVTKGSMESRPIELPPLSEQQRIVAILDEAFTGLATATANAEKNLINARELFESYLRLVFTGKGKGWVRCQIGDVATTQYGLSNTLNSDGDGYKIFRMGEVQDGRLVDTGRMKFIDIKRKEFEEYRLRRGDVLFNRTNSSDLVGKTGFFDLEGEYCFASYLVRVNFDPAKMNSKFAAYLMNTSEFLTRIRAKAARSVNQANINATILRNEAIDFPSSVQVQADLSAKFDALSLETRRLEQSYEDKLDQLAKLKQSVLQKAFSGELTSPPSQAIKEAAE